MIVYQHRRLDNNEIFYIGIGKTEKRAYDKYKRSKFWKRITNKIDYSVEIVCTCEDWNEACQIEQYLIKFYGRRDLGTGPLVNLTDGGEGAINTVVSNETKEKMSKSQTGRIISEEHRQKISKALKGEKHPMYGKPAPNAKKVINTETGVIYYTIKEAAEANGINKNTLIAMLSGRRINKTNLKNI